MNEVDNPDNSWFGTPTATLLVSQRKQDGAPPQEELRPRRDKEDKKRRRLEAKRQQPKAMVAKENIEVSAPKAPLAPLASESGQNDAPQVPGDVPASSVNVSTTHPHEEQPSGGPLDLQAGFRAEGVSLGSFEGNLSDFGIGGVYSHKRYSIGADSSSSWHRHRNI